MRLLLDAHVSGPRVARALREHGHDVRATDEERDLDGTTDEELLALATANDRILVTFDVADFPGIVRRWAEGGRSHAGCAIVVGIRTHEFGTIIRSLLSTMAARPSQADRKACTCFVSRAGS